MLKKILHKAGFAISITALVTLSSTINAEAYSPFSAKLPATLVSVNSASSIEVSAETWPGFSRTFNISLAGIEVPQNTPDVKLCQRELAEKALNFINEFLTDASTLEIHNMTMDTSADQNVQADIHTEKGSLSKALTSKGLARPSHPESEQPWC